MNTAFFTGVSGMVAYQKELDNLSHNIANVSTTGYKATRGNFADLLYTEMDTNGEPRPLVGHGVRVESSRLRFEQGTPVQTNNATDFAIIGEGFFAVERDGEVEYTRNGAFNIGIQGRRGYLTTADGAKVLDSRGRQIVLTRDNESTMFDLDELVDRVGVYLFDNPHGLERTNASSFVETELSGKARTLRGGRNVERPYQLVSHALESSAVDLADAMVDVMVTQKAFTFSAKMVQTADQIEEIVNNLR